MAIERCVCIKKSFAELKELADEWSLNYETLRACTGCGSGCGMCEPYVRQMLATGRTSFPVQCSVGRALKRAATTQTSPTTPVTRSLI